MHRFANLKRGVDRGKRLMTVGWRERGAREDFGGSGRRGEWRGRGISGEYGCTGSLRRVRLVGKGETLGKMIKQVQRNSLMSFLANFLFNH